MGCTPRAPAVPLARQQRDSAPGGWSRQPHLVRLDPEGWKREHPPQPPVQIGLPDEPQPELFVPAKQSRTAPRPAAVPQEAARGWARLIEKAYGADLVGGSRRQPGGALCAAPAATSR
jgi:hypothetical protein